MTEKEKRYNWSIERDRVISKYRMKERERERERERKRDWVILKEREKIERERERERLISKERKSKRENIGHINSRWKIGRTQWPRPSLLLRELKQQ